MTSAKLIHDRWTRVKLWWTMLMDKWHVPLIRVMLAMDPTTWCWLSLWQRCYVSKTKLLASTISQCHTNDNYAMQSMWHGCVTRFSSATLTTKTICWIGDWLCSTVWHWLSKIYNDNVNSWCQIDNRPWYCVILIIMMFFNKINSICQSYKIKHHLFVIGGSKSITTIGTNLMEYIEI
jgi:hypothetical protein